MASRRSAPSRSSIAMKRRPPSSPKSCTVTMFGWLRRAAACASRWKRCRVSSPGATRAVSVFRATKRLSTASLAL